MQLKTNGQHRFWQKKLEKFDFIKFFENKSHFICVKLHSMKKNISFKVLHVEIAQKLQNLEYLLIFSNFW